MIKANYRRPVTAIVPGAFTTMKNYTIYARERVGEELQGILIYIREGTNFPKTITADRGLINLSNGGNSLQAILYHGQMHERDRKDPDKYQISSFKRFTLNLPDLGYRLNEKGTDHRGDRELSSSAMLVIIEKKSAEIRSLIDHIEEIEKEILHLETDTLITRSEFLAGLDRNRELKKQKNMLRLDLDRKDKIQRDIYKYQVEVHKKYAIAVACLIFVLIGAPIGMMTRTSGVGMAFSVSSFVFLIYYGALTLGEELADKGQISPFIAMWIANIVFGILGIYLIIISVKEMKFIDIQGFFNRILKGLHVK